MRRIRSGAAAFLLLLFISCNMAGPDTDPVSGLDGKAAVRVSIGAAGMGSRTVRPSNAALDDVRYWELSAGLVGEEETKIEQQIFEDTVIYLEPGTYTFTLKGYNGDRFLILEGTIAEQEITLEPDTLVFTVAPVLTGTGTVSITVNLPDGHNIAAAKVYKDGEDLTPSPAAVVNGDQFIYTQTHDAGAYLFSIQLFDANGDLYGVVSELVQVRGNLRSEKTYTLTLADLNHKYLITYNLNGGEFDPGDEVENLGYYRSTDAGFTPPDPSRTGYTFAGWECRDNFGNWFDRPGIPAGSTGNMDFRARW
ncbi:MAG: InlB B-repeat-containing protein, partial [Treponema sp.]|nr:InlB B-repeat-containing protein [Treponema sp.]